MRRSCSTDRLASAGGAEVEMAQLTRRQMLAGAGAAGVLVAFGGDKALARDLPRQAR
jgi:hypothetical protein